MHGSPKGNKKKHRGDNPSDKEKLDIVASFNVSDSINYSNHDERALSAKGSRAPISMSTPKRPSTSASRPTNGTPTSNNRCD